MGFAAETVSGTPMLATGARLAQTFDYHNLLLALDVAKVPYRHSFKTERFAAATANGTPILDLDHALE